MLILVGALLFVNLGCSRKSSVTTPTESKFTIYENFEAFDAGELKSLSSDYGEWLASANNAEIIARSAGDGTKSIHILGGESKSCTLQLKEKGAKVISFKAERWTTRDPFNFIVEAKSGDKWSEVYNGSDEIKTGRFSTNVSFSIPDNIEAEALRFTVTSPNSSGALIDDLSILDNQKMYIKSIYTHQPELPVLIGKANNGMLMIEIEAVGGGSPLSVTDLTISMDGTDNIKEVAEVKIFATSSSYFSDEKQIGEGQNSSDKILFVPNHKLSHGKNHIWVSYTLAEGGNISSYFDASCLNISIANEEVSFTADDEGVQRGGVAVRQSNDDGSDCYRIPGLATTNKGTLIGVYDIRYKTCVDLQANVDVGMSRSIDGGQSWEAMQTIMDMGEWGGLSNDNNGIGDPAVLVDRSNNTIWVAAVWAHGHPGQRNWWASKPGLEPKETSQFILVKSTDDGKTWSEPINITKQIKDKGWYLVLQGPGKGITMKDGTLVFPAQFKDENQMPHSTIIYSKDGGENWVIGTGAKSNTTEAQVIELNDGSLMLNMRDNRNGKDKSDTNGRAVSVTSDLGKTWSVHPTSNGALNEPTCMASIIKEEFIVNGEKRELVLFSNPDTKSGRHHMTIKASFDDGASWPVESKLLIDEYSSAGYSCMSKIDDETVGILYEGSQAKMTFQAIKISDIIGN